MFSGIGGEHWELSVAPAIAVGHCGVRQQCANRLGISEKSGSIGFGHESFSMGEATLHAHHPPGQVWAPPMTPTPPPPGEATPPIVPSKLAWVGTDSIEPWEGAMQKHMLINIMFCSKWTWVMETVCVWCHQCCGRQGGFQLGIQ